jgi:hypothetical protein
MPDDAPVITATGWDIVSKKQFRCNPSKLDIAGTQLDTIKWRMWGDLAPEDIPHISVPAILASPAAAWGDLAGYVIFVS